MTTMKIKKQKVQKSVKFKSEDYINYLQASDSSKLKKSYWKWQFKIKITTNIQ